jgi:hypothetical protein
MGPDWSIKLIGENENLIGHLCPFLLKYHVYLCITVAVPRMIQVHEVVGIPVIHDKHGKSNSLI